MRYVKRTWRRTSEKICRANGIPPGFRIVLLDERGRAKRDDLIVRSGDFGADSIDIRIWAFLEDCIRNSVKDAGEGLDYDDVQLRNHRNEPIDPDTFLRQVLDMPGAGGKHSEQWHETQELISDIRLEIGELL